MVGVAHLHQSSTPRAPLSTSLEGIFGRRGALAASLGGGSERKEGAQLREDSRVHVHSRILDDIDLDLDTTVVKLKGGDSLRLIQVFHDNKPEYSSDSRVWEGGAVLARCLRVHAMSSRPYESLLSDDLVIPDSRMVLDTSHFSAGGGTVVIDLGSGTGVVGLAVARMGLAKHIFLTDMQAVVPLLIKNAELNADSLFTVFGHGDELAIARDMQKDAAVSVHAQALDWRKTGDGCAHRFAISRALSRFNAQFTAMANGVSCEGKGKRPFERVTVFASDCVYSPAEIDPFIGVLKSLVHDLRLIPGILAFELILTLKLRLYSETNRSACVKFLGELGRWVCGGPVEGQREEGEANEPVAVWASPERLLDVMRAGNSEDDLARRCGLCANALGASDAGARLELRDVRWKNRQDLVGDLPEKKTRDIAIFRITGISDSLTYPECNN